MVLYQYIKSLNAQEINISDTPIHDKLLHKIARVINSPLKNPLKITDNLYCFSEKQGKCDHKCFIDIGYDNVVVAFNLLYYEDEKSIICFYYVFHMHNDIFYAYEIQEFSKRKYNILYYDEQLDIWRCIYRNDRFLANYRMVENINRAITSLKVANNEDIFLFMIKYPLNIPFQLPEFERKIDEMFVSGLPQGITGIQFIDIEVELA